MKKRTTTIIITFIVCAIISVIGIILKCTNFFKSSTIKSASLIACGVIAILNLLNGEN